MPAPDDAISSDAISSDATAFKPLNIAVLAISDSRSLADDRSGDILVARLEADGHKLADRQIIIDEVPAIQSVVRPWIRDPQIDVVITTGGTGLTGRDVTPEAIEALYDKPIPGFGELFRMLSYRIIGTSTIQSRATGGVAGGTYLFALPGSTGAVKDAWDGILHEQLDIRHKPCNFAELMPRLKEDPAKRRSGDD